VVIGRWPAARTTGLLRGEQQFRADPVVVAGVVAFVKLVPAAEPDRVHSRFLGQGPAEVLHAARG
jgi:hypothetical protein